LLATIRPAHAQVARTGRLPMPRLALSVALDWKNMFAAEKRQPPAPPATAPTASRRDVPRLTVTSVVPPPPPSLDFPAYARLPRTVIKYVQPRKDVVAPELRPYVRAVCASPMFAYGSIGAYFTIETDALLR